MPPVSSLTRICPPPMTRGGTAAHHVKAALLFFFLFFSTSQSEARLVAGLPFLSNAKHNSVDAPFACLTWTFGQVSIEVY
jgi:hypothetical protein